MVFIATADAHGACDGSFRAGVPGFVRVLDAKTVLYPEYRGNGVLASLGNIAENPHIGMFFVDFFQSTVGLHINGTAQILENDAVLVCRAVYLHPADKYNRLTRRPSKGQEGLEERALIASLQPSAP